MPGKYGSHADYMDWVKDDADSRQEVIEDAHHKAFSNFIHINIPNRFRSDNIDSVVFASEVKGSVENAVSCRRKENL